MNAFQRTGMYIGKILLSSLFIWRGILQIVHWNSAEKSITTDIMNWHIFFNGSPWLENLAEGLLPLSLNFLIFGVMIQILCGMMLLMSWHARIASLILALYLLVQNFFANHFWMAEGYHREVLLLLFMQSLGLLGGLVVVMSAYKERTFGQPFQLGDDE